MIDKKTIEHIAKLSRLHVSEQEVNDYSQQLSTALDHFEQISEIDTEGVEPLVTPTDIEVYWRADEVKNEYTPEQMTANAPAKAGNLFKVPPVV